MEEARTSALVTHENDNVARAPVLWISLSALLFSVVLGALALAAFRARSDALDRAAPPAQERPGHSVSDVRTDLFRRGSGANDSDKARRRRELDQYGWVDRDRGIVRIPIDVAIDLELSEQRR